MSVYQLLWSTAGGGVDHSVPFRLGTAVRRADVRDGVKWQLLSCFCLHELSAFCVAPAPAPGKAGRLLDSFAVLSPPGRDRVSWRQRLHVNVADLQRYR